MRLMIKSWSKVLSGILLLATFTAVLLPDAGIGQILNNYLIHIMFMMIFFGFLGLVLNKRDLLFSSLAYAGILALYLKNASYLPLKYPKANQEAHFSIAHINLSNTASVADLMQTISEGTPDIISLQEFTPQWSGIVTELKSLGYPFSFQYPSADPYGKALFSRYKISDQSFLYLSGIPNAQVAIEKEGIRFYVYSIYLTPALNKTFKEQSSEQLTRLSQLLSGKKTHTFVLGEFNQVYWSSDVIRFRKETGLMNSRRDIIPNKSGAPYDHIFHSEDMECFSFSEISDKEGNHIGCKGKFQIKKKNKAQ